MTMTSVFRFVSTTVAALMVAMSASAADKVVVYNWTEYIPEGVLQEFTAATGIEVEYNTYESNEVMYSKIKIQNATGYDVIVPSAYYISRMAKEGLLADIDKSQLSNFKHLDTTLLNKPYDPGNQYSVPYTWGSTGIGIDTATIDKNSISSWKDLWDPKWKGSLLLTDDVREVFQMALAINGHSANTRDPAEIKQAYELLKKLMPNVLVFNSDAPREPYLAGDVSLGMIWNGEVIMAQEDMPEMDYIYPSEGVILWVDSFAIPANAEHKDAALKFINFMLRPDIAARTVDYIGYATPNKDALALLDEETRSNPIIFPSQEIISHGEFQEDVGEAANALFNQYWEALKTGM
ncbi:extracellular solute-binding protein [Oceanobacter antarcticus]|uniref:Putrescine-binding periplasmic protein n=1 Tax=Oceanobacter antarcticus TaxID=3133425 RepID=A0ABW8NL76_9GAMM